MPASTALTADNSEQRVYHAQLITILAVVPTFAGLAALLTAASLGARDMRGLVFAHPAAIALTLATAMLFILAWWLLGQRRREGSLLGAALFLWMLVSSVSHPKISWLSVAFAVAGLVALTRAWPAMQRDVHLSA